jgi:hypothetical protein
VLPIARIPGVVLLSHVGIACPGSATTLMGFPEVLNVTVAIFAPSLNHVIDSV